MSCHNVKSFASVKTEAKDLLKNVLCALCPYYCPVSGLGWAILTSAASKSNGLKKGFSLL